MVATWRARVRRSVRKSSISLCRTRSIAGSFFVDLRHAIQSLVGEFERRSQLRFIERQQSGAFESLEKLELHFVEQRAARHGVKLFERGDLLALTQAMNGVQ
jgi:hypothetical protein